MKGSRTDIETKSKVVKSLIKNPGKKLKEIAQETGLPISTVSDIKQSIPESVRKTSDFAIVEKIDAIIDKVTDITNQHLDEIAKKKGLKTFEVKALNDIAKINFDRKQLLTGGNTKNIGINNLKEYGTDDLLEILEG